MRLVVTADLHFNHARSRPLAEEAIARINREGGDVLLLVGDTAIGDGPTLEQALESITFAGPKLFVSGNHELWTTGADSHRLFENDLPARVRALGWQWLETDPFLAGDLAIVGSVGWYDYSYAPSSLSVPRRFYEAKISPGGAARLEGFEYLLGDDVSAHMHDIVARWNDGKFVHLGMSDADFLAGRVARLKQSLAACASASRVIAAIHHVPFRELLPPRQSPSWDFARAYLGSDALGKVLLDDHRVSHAYCGHSHFAVEMDIGPIRAINIGSGYRQKNVLALDV